MGNYLTLSLNIPSSGWNVLKEIIIFCFKNRGIFTAWKLSKYGVFSGPYFPAFGKIQSECGKTQARKNSVFGHFSRSDSPCQKSMIEHHSLHKKWSFPLRISLVNVKKSLMENFIFCAVIYVCQGHEIGLSLFCDSRISFYFIRIWSNEVIWTARIC